MTGLQTNCAIGLLLVPHTRKRIPQHLSLKLLCRQPLMSTPHYPRKQLGSKLGCTQLPHLFAQSLRPKLSRARKSPSFIHQPAWLRFRCLLPSLHTLPWLQKPPQSKLSCTQLPHPFARSPRSQPSQAKKSPSYIHQQASSRSRWPLRLLNTRLNSPPVMRPLRFTQPRHAMRRIIPQSALGQLLSFVSYKYEPIKETVYTNMFQLSL